MRRPLPLTAVLLAGGASRRMGWDKALLRFEGRRVIDLLVRHYAGLCRNVLVAPGRRRIPRVRTKQVGDPEGMEGPLAGLAAGLAASRTDWILLASCDQPPVPLALLELLWRARKGRSSSLLLDGRPLPFPALYRRGALAGAREGEGPSALLWRVPGGRTRGRSWRKDVTGWNTPAAFRRLARPALTS